MLAPERREAPARGPRRVGSAPCEHPGRCDKNPNPEDVKPNGFRPGHALREPGSSTFDRGPTYSIGHGTGRISPGAATADAKRTAPSHRGRSGGRRLSVGTL